MHSSIIPRIWLNFMAFESMVFIGSFRFYIPPPRISKYFGLSITEETWLVEMCIRCIKIGIVLVLHEDVTIACERLQNLGLCSGPLGRERSLLCHTFCDTGSRLFRSHPMDRPMQLPLTCKTRKELSYPKNICMPKNIHQK
jgi:hypothetical protein